MYNLWSRLKLYRLENNRVLCEVNDVMVEPTLSLEWNKSSIVRKFSAATQSKIAASKRKRFLLIVKRKDN